MKLADLPKSYMTLLEEFPLRPIKTRAEHDQAVKIVHRLAMREDEADAGEQIYLEVLETLVDRYENEHFAMDLDDVTPCHVLRMLVEQAGMSVSELGVLLGSKGAASELLSGKRKEPSKAQIAKLCARFKVDASLFLLPASKSAGAA